MFRRVTRIIRSVSPEKTKLRASRYTRYSRYSRYSRLSGKQIENFFVRRSLAECVYEELEQQGRALFYQRVYILAKNVVIIPTIHSAQSQINMDEEVPKENFSTIFMEKLNAIIRHCNKETFTEDKITGLFLCMGDYTLLVIEGCEDMVAEFCKELATDIVNYWAVNKVFLVEDKIDNVYFSTFVKQSSIAVNINEKFPTSTSNDEFLMGKQHWQIREKLHFLCALLAKEFHENSNHEEMLSSEYYKWLLEVQRIELVLNSSRYYRNVQDYSTVYGRIPMQNDEDAFIWPVPYGYTPLGVFQRSPYDVNLTFSNYGKEDTRIDEKAMEEGGEEEQHNAQNAAI